MSRFLPLLFLLLPFWCAEGRPSGRLHIRHVTIEGMKFKPAVLKAKVGDLIVWTNKDLVPHTVTAESLVGARFSSGTINPGHQFKLKATFVGQVRYKCLFHPTMKAKLTVTR